MTPSLRKSRHPAPGKFTVDYLYERQYNISPPPFNKVLSNVSGGRRRGYGWLVEALTGRQLILRIECRATVQQPRISELMLYTGCPWRLCARHSQATVGTTGISTAMRSTTKCRLQ